MDDKTAVGMSKKFQAYGATTDTSGNETSNQMEQQQEA